MRALVKPTASVFVLPCHTMWLRYTASHRNALVGHARRLAYWSGERFVYRSGELFAYRSEERGKQLISTSLQSFSYHTPTHEKLVQYSWLRDLQQRYLYQYNESCGGWVLRRYGLEDGTRSAGHIRCVDGLWGCVNHQVCAVRVPLQCIPWQLSFTWKKWCIQIAASHTVLEKLFTSHRCPWRSCVCTIFDIANSKRMIPGT